MEVFSSEGRLVQAPLFATKPKNAPKERSWRDGFVNEIVELINFERVGTKYKPVTARFIAIKVAHLKNGQDFHYVISVCKDAKRRDGSFSRKFFSMFKIVENYAKRT